MKVTKVIKGFLTVMMLTILIGTTVAYAEEVEGGTWNAGLKNLYMTVYSDYLHPTYIHGSSVQGAWFDSDYNEPKGTWSRGW